MRIRTFFVTLTALLIWCALPSRASSPSPEPIPDDRALQVYYHMTYFGALWRSDAEPGVLFRQSLLLGGITLGLRGLRRVVRRGVLL